MGEIITILFSVLQFPSLCYNSMVFSSKEKTRRLEGIWGYTDQGNKTWIEEDRFNTSYRNEWLVKIEAVLIKELCGKWHRSSLEGITTFCGGATICHVTQDTPLSHLGSFDQTGYWKQLRKGRPKLEPRIIQADAARIWSSTMESPHYAWGPEDKVALSSRKARPQLQSKHWVLKVPSKE